MTNLVTELIRDYRRTLLARYKARKKALSAPATRPSKPQLPPVLERRPHKPAPDHHLRTSHF
jgi:hypothetical protein